jgi:N-acetylneuraminic acid mutarotase
MPARFIVVVVVAAMVVAPACSDDGVAPDTHRSATSTAVTIDILTSPFPGTPLQLDLPRFRDPLASHGWSPRLTDMPTPRAEVSAAVVAGLIYVVGGFTENGQNSDAVEVYDPTADAWSNIEPMPERLDHAMAAAANDKVYVMGGWRLFGEQASDALYEYDPRTEAWRSLAPMPLPRAAGAAVSGGGSLYVVGGVGPDPEVTLKYNIDSDSWERTAPIPSPREHLAAVYDGGKVYVIGGRWPDRGNVDTVEAYDVFADEWESRQPMPTARGGLAAALVDGKIHVVGGESFGDGSRTFEEHEVYDTRTDSWATLRSLPLSRHGLAAVGVGKSVYVIAGGRTPGLSVSGIVHVFEPLDE